MPPSNGGTPNPLRLALFPITVGVAGQMYTFDPTNFNDVLEPSSYSWKVEDILMGRTPTISRVILSFRNLGVANITLTLTGTNDNQTVVSASTALVIGTNPPTNRITTLVVGLSLTADNLQLTITRAANGGPVSITKVRMEGRLDTNPYA